MMQGLRELWGKIQYNIKRVMDSDPAATSVWMVIWTYPHITALFWHFFAHRLYKAGWPILARRVALHSRHVTGIEIHPGATIGRGLFIDHGMGVVIGETAIVVAKRIAREEPKANIVVIAPDGVEKYLSLLDFGNNEYVK